MNLSQREVAKDQRQALAEMPFELLDDGVCLSTGRALVIAVFDEYAWRNGVSLKVVFGTHSDGEFRHRVSLFFREVFQRFQNAVGARIDGNWGAIAPGDRALRVNYKQRALRNTVF